MPLDRRSHQYATVGSIGIVVLAILAVVHSQDQSLDISIALDKTPVIVGEPVVVHILLSNDSNRSVMLPDQLNPEYGHIRYFTQRGAEPEREFVPWAMIENSLESPLPSGIARAVTAKIFFGARGWTFPSPGEYTVRAAFRGRSATAPLTVVASNNPDERNQASALMENPEAGLFLLVDGGDEAGKGADAIRRIAASPTRLSGYANRALAISLSQRFVNLGTNSVRAADPSAAEGFARRSQELLPADAIYYTLETTTLQVAVARSLAKPKDVALFQQRLEQMLDGLLAKPLPDATKGFVQASALVMRQQ